MTTLIMPLSPKMSASRTCRVKTSGSFSASPTSGSVYRRVVRLYWLDLLMSWTMRARPVASKGWKVIVMSSDAR